MDNSEITTWQGRFSYIDIGSFFVNESLIMIILYDATENLSLTQLLKMDFHYTSIIIWKNQNVQTS